MEYNMDSETFKAMQAKAFAKRSISQFVSSA